MTDKHRSLKPNAEKSGSRQVIALTGAASFLGRNLIGVLEEDESIERIIAADVETPPTLGPKSRLYEIDLTQPGSETQLAEILRAEGVHTVVHLASLAFPSHSSTWAHELESVGTMRVTTACRAAGIDKLIYRSSTMLYGALPSNPNFLSEQNSLHADADEPFFRDKIEAEYEVHKFAKHSKTVTTILRMAPIVGPTVYNLNTYYFSLKIVPTILGYDPLIQLLHEVDAIAALKHAIDYDVSGTFNIAGDGVLPLSTALRITGHRLAPVPYRALRTIARALWASQFTKIPASFLEFLRFLCVADSTQTRDTFQFEPSYTTREAISDFASAQRLREVRLLDVANLSNTSSFTLRV